MFQFEDSKKLRKNKKLVPAPSRGHLFIARRESVDDSAFNASAEINVSAEIEETRREKVRLDLSPLQYQNSARRKSKIIKRKTQN